jgi:hypothetical protein
VRERNEALDIRKYFLAGVDILKPNLTAIAKHLAAGLPEPVVKVYELKPAGGEVQSPESKGQSSAAPATPPVAAKPIPKALRPRRPGRGGFVSAWRK